MKYICVAKSLPMRLGRDKAERTLLGPTITDDDPVLSDAEVAQWLDLFGPVDENALTQPPPKPIPPKPCQLLSLNRKWKKQTSDLPKPPATALTAKTPNLAMRNYANGSPFLAASYSLKQNHQQKANDKPAKKATPHAKKKKTPNPHNLKDNDLAAWNAYFGQDD